MNLKQDLLGAEEDEQNAQGPSLAPPPPTKPPTEAAVNEVNQQQAETLVALELRCISAKRDGDDGESDSVLDGPYTVFVEAKIYDVSASSSRQASVIMSETDESEGEQQMLAAEEEEEAPKGARSPAAVAAPADDSSAEEEPTTKAKRPAKLRLRVETPSRESLDSGEDFQFTRSGSSPPPTPNQFNFDYPLTPHEKVSIELDCPQRFVGRLIGKRGTTVRRLEQATGVQMQIDQNLPEGQPRRVKISGHPSIVDEAERVVREVINYGPPELNKKNVYKTAANSNACEAAKARASARAGNGRKDPRRTLFTASPPHPADPSMAFGRADYYHGAPGASLHMPPHASQAYFAAAAAAGNMFLPGFPDMKPSFKVAGTAALAVQRFWAEYRAANGTKYYVNQYTGELMTDFRSNSSNTSSSNSSS